jgi:hypothetical protein
MQNKTTVTNLIQKKSMSPGSNLASKYALINSASYFFPNHKTTQTAPQKSINIPLLD